VQCLVLLVEEQVLAVNPHGPFFRVDIVFGSHTSIASVDTRLTSGSVDSQRLIDIQNNFVPSTHFAPYLMLHLSPIQAALEMRR
jgi:hypothetical protein